MKSLKALLTFTDGFSMVELTVTLGLIGFMGLSVASLFQLLNSEQKSSEALAARTEFAGALGIHLYSPKGCTDIKTGTYSSTTDTPMALNNWVYQGVGGISSGKEMKMFTVERITGRLQDISLLPTVKMTMSDGSVRDLKKTMLVITATLKLKDKKSSQDKKAYNHMFNVPVMTNGTTVDFCGDERTLAETCTAIDGKFNPATKQCQVKENCTFHGSFVTLTCYPIISGACDTSRGTAQVNPQTGIFGCPAGSTAVSTGGDTWTTQRSCGKKCTADINTTLGYYSCLRCSDL